MAEQQYQEEFTDIILEEVREGKQTVDEVAETKEFLESQGAVNLDLYKSSCEALTILQPQQ